VLYDGRFGTTEGGSVRYRDHGLIVTPDGRELVRVEPDYRAGPVPCIVARERYIERVLLPLMAALIEEAAA